MKLVIAGFCLVMMLASLPSLGLASKPSIIDQLAPGATVAGPFAWSVEANESVYTVLFKVTVSSASPSPAGVWGELGVADPAGAWSNVLWCPLQPVLLDSATVQFTFRLASGLAEKATLTLSEGASPLITKRGWRMDLASYLKDE